jgi:probable phosphoglycerate mutase
VAVTATTVYLMRHGETAGDGVKRYVGQTDLPLSRRGKRQAEAWGRHFRDIPLAAIFSSDLERARESAATIAGKRPLPLKIKTGLREISLGGWENMAMAEIEEQAQREFRHRGAAIDTHRPPGGESFLDLQQRAVTTFHGILAEIARGASAAGDLLIVAHAGVNRVLLCHLLGMPLPHLFRLGQDFACLNTCVQRPDGFRVLGINATLPAAP